MGLFHQSKDSVPQQGQSSKSYFVPKGEQKIRNDIWDKLLKAESSAPRGPGVENWKHTFNHKIYENLDESEREEFWRTGDCYERGWVEKENYLKKTLVGWPEKQKQKYVVGQLLVMTDEKGWDFDTVWHKWRKIIWPKDYDWTDSLEEKIDKYIH